MKKLLIMIGLLALSLPTSAQDDVSIKPQAKTFTAEVNFSPFSSSPIYINYLRFRFFNTEKTAFRLGASVGVDNQNPNTDVSRNSFEFNLRPGFEWHMKGTERLSPYFGLEADFAYKSSKYEDTSSDIVVEGAWDDFGTERGFTRYGLNAIIGADFYIAKRLYLGTEIGFGFESKRNKDIVAKENGVLAYESKGGSAFQLGPNFNSAIRLGFVF